MAPITPRNGSPPANEPRRQDDEERAHHQGDAGEADALDEGSAGFTVVGHVTAAVTVPPPRDSGS